jgi:hypothetical protein
MTDDAGPKADICALMDEHAATHPARDAERVLGLYLPGAVGCTRAPPLQQGPDTPYGSSRDFSDGSPHSTDWSARATATSR